MANEEFDDLQKFGKTIKKENINNKQKNSFVKNINKEKIHYFCKKIYKRLIFTKIRVKKYCQKLAFSVDTFIRKISKTNISFPNWFKQKDYIKCYKLRERRKIRKNKTIIVRKRVPYKLKREHIGPAKTNLENLVHLTFDSGIYYHSYKPTTKNHKTKESIWDFK